MVLFSITRSAASIQHEWLEAIGLLLNEPVIFLLIIVGLGLFFERKNEERIHLAAALLITFILVSAIKSTLAVERPCIAMPGAVCPIGYSLPSMHAAISFTLMFAFLERRMFLFFLVFSLFVSFTRLNLGVHTFEDVAAALPIAFMSFFLAQNIWNQISSPEPRLRSDDCAAISNADDVREEKSQVARSGWRRWGK
jgi:membrane-associated phospholipid phosphatase